MTAEAVIAYVGSVAHYFDKFIAIAYEDVYNSGTSWTNAKTYLGTFAANHPITVGGMIYNTNAGGDAYYDLVTTGTENPSNTRTGDVIKGWRVPSVTDWRYIFQGLCSGPSATSPVGIASYGNYGNGSTLRNAINTACGNTNLQNTWYHANSNGTTYGGLWNFDFSSGQFKDYVDNGFRTRAVFAY